ncbi:MAG: DUF4215 domain-containing protein [Minicystis sp.]
MSHLSRARFLPIGKLYLTLAGVVLVACGGGGSGSTSNHGGGGTGTSSASSTGSGNGGQGQGGNIFNPTTGPGGAATGGTGGGMLPGPACGDGKVDPGEACDDGNGDSGDGCTGTCDAIENNFACPTPGAPCVSTVVCGDAKINGDETCDDQNTTPGDGCDANCHVELGWKCLVVGAACTAAQCGDGIVAGQEQCDDGNGAPGDGCSATCQLEAGYKCPTPGAPCTPTVCGDGVAEGTEQCDDGNHNLGDGCTPFCVKEPDCTMGACTSSCGDGIKLPNGTEQCEDGNTKAGDGCSPTCTVEPGFQCMDVGTAATQLVLPIVFRDFSSSHPDFEKYSGVDYTIVTQNLGTDGKPVYANPTGTTPTTSGKANFDQWYNDVTGVNIPILKTITLSQLPTGEFQYNNSSFFLLDGQGFGNQGNSHNYHFTSEVRYWFEYKGNEQLDFTGDDDVWVYVNKKLAVNLGGVHGPLSGGIKLDATAAANFGLTVGSIYEIAVFQAERHTSGSNYKLTLSNFVNKTSVCTAVCGDGIKTPTEACDDGINDGAYGHCTSDCNFGPFCGDGIVQPGMEECDDGVNLSPYGGCAPGCKKGAFCGDGKVDSTFGEECDDGVNDGSYGKCDMGCVLGPRCGDGVVQSPQEQCDDGNKINGDGCNNDCKVGSPE